MGRVAIVVVDALGIGAMADVPETRPRDAGANTLLHVLRWREEHLRDPAPLANLARLGLGRLLSHPALPVGLEETGTSAVRSGLGYPGADSYVAHQTMMGTDMTGLRLEPFSLEERAVSEALAEAGHEVRRALPGMPILLVDGCVVVGDNLEADPGLNYNVTGSLELTDFGHISRVAAVVREVVSVARVIAVGGPGLDAAGLVANLRRGVGEVYGIDTPATGFYDGEGLRVRHMGVDLDHSKQLPTVAVRSGIPVALVGKMADVIDCPGAEYLPCVDTEEVIENTVRAVRERSEGLVAANVQETDLAGHRQDPARWADRLELADRGIGRIVELLAPEDLLLVLGDHGNDPTVGHEFHTREYVPILAARGEMGEGGTAPDRNTLADVGATAAAALGLAVDGLEVGVPIPGLAPAVAARSDREP